MGLRESFVMTGKWSEGVHRVEAGASIPIQVGRNLRPVKTGGEDKFLQSKCIWRSVLALAVDLLAFEISSTCLQSASAALRVHGGGSEEQTATATAVQLQAPQPSIAEDRATDSDRLPH